MLVFSVAVFLKRRDRYEVDVLGDYNPRFETSTLERARYRFTCTAPEDVQLSNIFSQCMSLLEFFQKQVPNAIDDRRNMLSTISKQPAIKFIKDVIEELVSEK